MQLKTFLSPLLMQLMRGVLVFCARDLEFLFAIKFKVNLVFVRNGVFDVCRTA